MEAPTYEAKIYSGYLPRGNAPKLARDVVRGYVNGIGLCVTFTETEYIYKGGYEDGFVVGLINYPRFPSDPETIKHHALTLAQLLKDVMKQTRVSVVLPDVTVTLGPK